MTTKLHKVVKRQTQDAYPERHTYGKLTHASLLANVN